MHTDISSEFLWFRIKIPNIIVREGMERDEGWWYGKQDLVVGQGRTSLFSCSVSDISFGRLLSEGLKRTTYSLLSRGGQGCPWSLLGFLCMCVVGSGSCSHSVGCLQSSLSQSQWEALLLLKAGGKKNLFNSWFCLWKHLFLFSSVV